MALDLQSGIALVIVAVCAVYIGRRLYRTWFGKAQGCAGGCGCDASEQTSQDGEHARG